MSAPRLTRCDDCLRYKVLAGVHLGMCHRLSRRVRGSHRCADVKPFAFGGTYDLERRGDEVFCERCGAGPLERTNGTAQEFDYEDGKGVFQIPAPVGVSRKATK